MGPGNRRTSNPYVIKVNNILKKLESDVRAKKIVLSDAFIQEADRIISRIQKKMQK